MVLRARMAFYRAEECALHTRRASRIRCQSKYARWCREKGHRTSTYLPRTGLVCASTLDKVQVAAGRRGVPIRAALLVLVEYWTRRARRGANDDGFDSGATRRVAPYIRAASRGDARSRYIDMLARTA